VKELGVEAFSDVVVGKGFGDTEKAGGVFVASVLFTNEEEVTLDCFSGLTSKDKPERSAIDADRAAWNEFVKPGMVDKHAQQSFERPPQYADVEKCSNSSRSLYSNALLCDVWQILIYQDQCCHKLRTLIVLSRDTLSSFSSPH